MPTPIDTLMDSLIYNLARPLVYVSSDVTDPASWDLVPFLWCDELKLAVNAYSTASLHYEVGEGVMQAGDTHLLNYQPLDLRGKYVQVFVDNDDPSMIIRWVGYVLSDQLARDGVKETAGVNKFQ